MAVKACVVEECFGKEVFGLAGSLWQGAAVPVAARYDMAVLARQAWSVMSRQCAAWRGVYWQAWNGKSRQGTAWPGAHVSAGKDRWGKDGGDGVVRQAGSVASHRLRWNHTERAQPSSKIESQEVSAAKPSEDQTRRASLRY